MGLCLPLLSDLIQCLFCVHISVSFVAIQVITLWSSMWRKNYGQGKNEQLRLDELGAM